MTVHFQQFSSFQGKSLVTTLCFMKGILGLGLRDAQNVFRNVRNVLKNSQTSSDMIGTSSKIQTLLRQTKISHL